MMQFPDLPYDFQRAVRKELHEGERVIWYTQPDVDAIAKSLLPFSVIWLSGLFLMSVGMLLHSPGNTNNLLGGLIFILILVTVAGVFELIFVPRRAARTIYALTNQRAFAICITKKLNVELEPDEEKRILKEDPSTPFGFYMSNLPSQVLLLLATSDVVRALAHQLDLFLAAGFGLILTGWLMPWVNELKLPFAKFREAPRVLYSIHDMFVTCQSLTREQMKKVKLRKVDKDLFNMCVISNDAGCLRFRAVKGQSKASEFVEELAKEPVAS